MGWDRKTSRKQKSTALLFHEAPLPHRFFRIETGGGRLGAWVCVCPQLHANPALLGARSHRLPPMLKPNTWLLGNPLQSPSAGCGMSSRVFGMREDPRAAPTHLWQAGKQTSLRQQKA